MTLPPEPPQDATPHVGSGEDDSADARHYRGDSEFTDAADPAAPLRAAADTDRPQAALQLEYPQKPQAQDQEHEPKTKRKGPTFVDPAKIRQVPLADPDPPSGHGPAVVLAICNQKGGVGKTTSTINLGAALAEFGRRVLLVDFDPQGALSVGLGISPHDLDMTVYNLLLQRGVNPEEVVMRTSTKGLDLLPSNIDLSAAEIQLVNEVAREQTLERVLRPLLPQYDYILIDCQPSLGLLTVNALTAARGVLIPLECEYFSLRG
ncbi:MAG: AAA family ATPase, partial [Antricoccus sp.]